VGTLRDISRSWREQDVTTTSVVGDSGSTATLPLEGVSTILACAGATSAAEANGVMALSTQQHFQAPVGRSGVLQLPRDTRKPRQSGCVPGSIAGDVVAESSPPEPATSPPLDAPTGAGSPLATPTLRAPSLSRSTLRR
jgi:hypothetical protein